MRFRIWIFTVFALMAYATPSSAQGGCCIPALKLTWRQKLELADLVVYGVVTKSEPAAGALPGAGKSEFQVMQVLKDHPARKGAGILTLDLFMPVKNQNNLPQYIVCFEFTKDVLKPYLGIDIPSRDLKVYFSQLNELRRNSPLERTLFFLNHADHDNSEIRDDAMLELSKLTENKEIAQQLPCSRIFQLLTSKTTPPEHIGMLGSLLGHCGVASRHGDLLRALIEEPRNMKFGTLEGLLTGYAMLQQKEAWRLIQNLIKDRNAPFAVHYSVLVALRQIWNDPQEAFTSHDVLECMGHLLSIPDVSDFVMDDLRTWKVWDKTKSVLSLDGQKDFGTPVIRRAILRFALSSPTLEAEDFVRGMRVRDPQWVRDTEDILCFERGTKR